MNPPHGRGSHHAVAHQLHRLILARTIHEALLLRGGRRTNTNSRFRSLGVLDGPHLRRAPGRKRHSACCTSCPRDESLVKQLGPSCSIPTLPVRARAPEPCSFARCHEARDSPSSTRRLAENRLPLGDEPAPLRTQTLGARRAKKTAGDGKRTRWKASGRNRRRANAQRVAA